MPQQPYVCPFCHVEHETVQEKTRYRVEDCALGEYYIDVKFLYFLPSLSRTTFRWIERFEKTLRSLIASGSQQGRPYTIHWHDVEWDMEPHDP